jgi:hypothetical protein
MASNERPTSKMRVFRDAVGTFSTHSIQTGAGSPFLRKVCSGLSHSHGFQFDRVTLSAVSSFPQGS